MSVENNVPRAVDGILSFISYLDQHGASEWSLRAVAAFAAAVFLAVRSLIGKPGNVEWHALIHAAVSALGAVMCLCLDIYAAESMTGTPEPIRSIRCEGPLTSLHSIVPAITLGYSVSDMLDGLHLGKDFLMHGGAVAIVFSVVCELGLSHHITPMLLMEISTIPLQFVGATFLSSTQKIVVQLQFVLSFFLVRISLVPYLWFKWIQAFLEEEEKNESGMCFPHFFIYVVVFAGIFFHGLNFYWFVKIIKKVRRKLGQKESMDDSKYD